MNGAVYDEPSSADDMGSESELLESGESEEDDEEDDEQRHTAEPVRAVVSESDAVGVTAQTIEMFLEKTKVCVCACVMSAACDIPAYSL